jgi:hypothetical protein
MKLFPNLVRSLDETVKEMMPRQVSDSSRPDNGGWFSPELGFASPYHLGNARYITLLGYAYSTDESEFAGSPEILRRIMEAVAFQRRCARESGLYDLPFTNFDSPTDTSFSLAAIGGALWMARSNPRVDADELDQAVRPYILPAANAVAEAGFHTPNHRWVVAAALSQAAELYPELDVQSSIEAYLAEGVDVNEDGQYSERSNGGYNAVCNTHLLQTAEALGRPEIVDAVRMNIWFMYHLLHDDGSVVTSTSLRQDSGRKIVPSVAADGFFYMGMQDGSPDLLKVAADLVRLGSKENFSILYWLARHPEWRDAEVATADSSPGYAKHFSSSGIWRVRRGRMSATAANGVSDTFALVYGDVRLRGVRLHSPYFAGARFTGRSLSVEGRTATMELRSDFFLPQLPGYWKPLGRPVPYADLPFNNLDDRDVIPRPEFTFRLAIQEVDGGFDLRVTSEGGMEQVPFVLTFLFEGSGRIEMDQVSFPATPGADLLLKSGALTYRVGDDSITIGPGFYGHRMTVPPGAEPADDAVRVTMTDWTHVNRAIRVRCGRWTESEGEYLAHGGPAHLNAGSGYERDTEHT